MHKEHDLIETYFGHKLCVNCGKNSEDGLGSSCKGEIALDEKVFIKKAKELCRERYLKEGAGQAGFDDFGFSLAGLFLGLTGIEDSDEDVY